MSYYETVRLPDPRCITTRQMAEYLRLIAECIRENNPELLDSAALLLERESKE